MELPFRSMIVLEGGTLNVFNVEQGWPRIALYLPCYVQHSIMICLKGD